jgi:hypothetical protein
MMTEYSEYFVLGIALVIGVISWMLKKEHSRIEALEGDHHELNSRLSRAINEIAKNDVADREWRKRVEENHRGLLKADEDRRGDARKIYDKIEKTNEKIQRLAELIAGK